VVKHSPQFKLLHLGRTGSLPNFSAVLILLHYTALPEESVWPRPGKEPHQNVDRAIFVTIHDESAFCAAIRPFVERHILSMSALATGFRRIAFIL
jgi:hypothetical protein